MTDTTSSPPRVGGDFFLYTRRGLDYFTDVEGRTYRVNPKSGLRQYPGRPSGWEPKPRRWWHSFHIGHSVYTVKFERKLADLWVGAFWKKGDFDYLPNLQEYHLWICIVPCFPIHVRWSRHEPDDRQ